QAEDGIRDLIVTGVQTCALPILASPSITRAGLPLAGAAPKQIKWCACMFRNNRVHPLYCVFIQYFNLLRLFQLFLPMPSEPSARSEERRVGKACRSRSASACLSE